MLYPTFSLGILLGSAWSFWNSSPPKKKGITLFIAYSIPDYHLLKVGEGTKCFFYKCSVAKSYSVQLFLLRMHKSLGDGTENPSQMILDSIQDSYIFFRQFQHLLERLWPSGDVSPYAMGLSPHQKLLEFSFQITVRNNRYHCQCNSVTGSLETNTLLQ